MTQSNKAFRAAFTFLFTFLAGMLFLASGWFNEASAQANSSGNGAQFVSQSVPTQMTALKFYPVSVTMRNTGTTTWPAYSTYKLGAQNPQDNTTWLASARVVVTRDVYPGQDYTFNFDVKAPALTWSFAFQWQMLNEADTWFGEYSSNAMVQVTVDQLPAFLKFTACSSTTPVTSPAQASMSCTLSNIGQLPTNSISYPALSGMRVEGPTGYCASAAVCGTVRVFTNGGEGNFTGTLVATPVADGGVSASTNIDLRVNSASVPEPTIAVSRTNIQAGSSFTTTWSTTNATSVSYSCTANGAGFNGSASLAINGSEDRVAQAAWVGNPSTCTWTASGPGGNKTYVDTVNTTGGAGQPVLGFSITAPSNYPNGPLHATVAVGQSFTVGWSLTGVTDPVLSCTDGFATYDTSAISSANGERTLVARAEWANGRDIGCMITAKANGVQVSSQMVSITVPTPSSAPTLVVNRTAITAGVSYTTTWTSTNATSVSYSCVAAASGFNGSATLPANGSEDRLAQVGWVGSPSTCTWTATGPGGSKTFIDTINTLNPSVEASVVLSITSPNNAPNTSTNATVAVDQPFTLSWSLAGVTNANLSCTDGFTSYDVGAVSSSGERTIFAPAAWATGRSMGCMIVAKKLNGSQITSQMVSITVPIPPTAPTLEVSRTSITAGTSFKTTWTSTNATSVSYSCVAAPTGFNGSATLPANGSEDRFAQVGWVGSPSTCTWTASGPGGSKTYVDTINTLTPPVEASVALSITAPNNSPNTSTNATVAVGQSFTLSWTLAGVTDANLSCTDGFTTYETAAISSSTGDRAIVARPEWATGRNMGCMIVAKKLNGSQISSQMVSITVPVPPTAPTLDVVRTSITAGASYKTTWTSTNATSVSYSCVAAPTGFNGSATLPANGNEDRVAQLGWVGSPSTCTWTASGPGGSKTFVDTINTLNPPAEPIVALSITAPNSAPNTSATATVAVGQSFTLSWSLIAVTDANLSCTDGFTTYEAVAINSSTGDRTIVARPEWATGRSMGCMIVAKKLNGSQITSQMVSINVPIPPTAPTLTVNRTTITAGATYTTTWTSTNATSVSYSCVAAASGFNDSATLPANGSEDRIAQAGWVGSPSTCIWTATGPGGIKTLFDTINTLNPALESSVALSITAPNNAPNTSTAATVAVGQSFTLSWSLVAVTDANLSCTDGFTTFDTAAISSSTGDRTIATRPEWATGRNVGCMIVAKKLNGNQITSPMVSITVPVPPTAPTLTVNRTTITAGASFKTTWTSTNATSVSYSCIAAPTGFNGSATLPANGSEDRVAQAGWVGSPSTCTWTATGPGGTKTFSDVINTMPDTNNSDPCAALTPKSGIYTGSSSVGNVWGNNETGYSVNSDIGKALIHSRLRIEGGSAYIKVTSLGSVPTLVGTTANGVTSNSSSTAQCAMKLSIGDGSSLSKPTISVTRNPTPLVANRSFTSSWETTNATSVSYICTANNGGFSGNSGDLPLNGTSAPGVAATSWIANPSTCVWTASGPGGTTKITEVMNTSPEPAVSANCLAKTPKSGTYTGALTGGEVWGNNAQGFTFNSNLGKALVQSGLLANGTSGDITITPLDTVPGFTGTSANGVISASSITPECGMMLSKPGFVPAPTVTLKSNITNIRIPSGGMSVINLKIQATQTSGQIKKAEVFMDTGTGYVFQSSTAGTSSTMSYDFLAFVSAGSYRFKARATNQNDVIADSNDLVINIIDSNLLGEISGIRSTDGSSSKLELVGWACQQDTDQALNYKLYADAPSKLGGTLITSGSANINTEARSADIRKICNTPNAGHHFVIDLSPYSFQYQGKRLYVEAATNDGISKATLPCADNSCTMPGALRIALINPKSTNLDRLPGPATVFMSASIDNSTGSYDEVAFNINDEWIKGIADATIPNTYYASKANVPSRATAYPVIAKVRQGSTTLYSTEHLIYIDASVPGLPSAVKLEITKPAKNSNVKIGVSADVVVKVTVAEGGTNLITAVKLFADDKEVAVAVKGDTGWTAKWTPAQKGEVQLEARSFDSDGKSVVNSAKVKVNVTQGGRLIPMSADLVPVPITPPHLDNPDAGTLPGNLQVGNDGTASYSIPIAVPPGTADVQPALSINYNSNGSNGHLGLGWSLGGLSTIHRCPKTIAQDDTTGRISFDAEDRLCLDGKRLIRVSGANTGTDTTAADSAYWANDAEYRTEIESFSRITRQSNGGFKVESKDGKIHYYGTKPNSAIVAQGRNDNQMLLWAVERTEDRMGNFVEVDYSQNTSELNGASDVNTGEYLPKQVRYGAANNGSDLAVKFKYEQRSDAQIQYMGGSRNDMRSRLTHIETYTNTQPDGSGGAQVRDYELHYATANVSGRNMLDWVRACASNPQSGQKECLPRTIFEWGASGDPSLTNLSSVSEISMPITEPQGLMPKTVNGVNYGPGNASDYYGDLDGSGKTSWIRNRKLDCEFYSPWNICGLIPIPEVPNILKIRLPDGREIERTLVMEAAGLPRNAVLKLLVGDLDGDGRDDLILEDQTRGHHAWGYCLTVPQSDGTVNFDCKPSPANSLPILDQQPLVLVDLNRDRQMHLLLPFDSNGKGGDCFFANGNMQCKQLQMFDLTPLPSDALTWGRFRSMGAAVNLSKQGNSDLIMYWEYDVPKADPYSDITSCSPSGQCIKIDVKLRIASCINKSRGLECTAMFPDINANTISLNDVHISSGDINNDGLNDISVVVDGVGRYICLSKEIGVDCLPKQLTVQLSVGPGNFSWRGIVGNFVGDDVNRFIDVLGDWQKGEYAIRYGLSGMSGNHISVPTDAWIPAATSHVVDATGKPIAYPISDYFSQSPLIFDDSGIPKFWDQSGSKYQPKKKVHAFTMTLPASQDKIISITNGAGYREELDYARGDDEAVYRRHAVIDGVETRPTLLQRAVPPSTMVKALRRTNGKGGWLTSTYAYEGFKIDTQGRGSLGFVKFTETNNSSGIVTTSILSQDFPFVGMVKRSNSVHGGTNVKSILNTLAQQSISWAASNNTLFPYISRTETASADLDGSDLGTQVTESEYKDGYGNLTRLNITNSVAGGLSFTSSKIVQYKNDTANWFIGLPETEQTLKTEPTYGTITRNVIRTFAPGNGLLQTETQEKGEQLYEVKNTYDRSGNVFGLVNKKTQSWFDPVTQALVQRDVSTTGYDGKGRFIKTIANAKGHSETREYDAGTGAMLKQTDANGLSKTWEINGFGRPTKLTNPDLTSVRYYQKKCDGICPNLAVVATINDYFFLDTRMAVPSLSYSDNAGHEVQKVTYGFDGSKIMTDQSFDDQGRPSEVYQPRFEGDAQNLASRKSYDDMNRVVQLEMPNEANQLMRSTTEYHGLMQRLTNAKNQVRVDTRDVLGQLRSVQDANNGTTGFEYDAFGGLKQTRDPNGNLIKMSYDRLGRKTELNDPDLGRIEYRVDPVGRTWRQINPTQRPSSSADMTYDMLDRMVSRIEPSLNSYWVYDTGSYGVGKLSLATTKNAGGTETYRREHTYDNRGRPKTTTQMLSDGNYTGTITYDAWGRLSTQQHQRNNGAATLFSNRYNLYAYPAQVLRRGKEDSAVEQVLWQANALDAAGRTRESAFGNELTQKRTYSDYSTRLMNADLGLSDAPQGTPRLTEGYAYDALGNVSQRTQYWDADGFIETFSYDNLNRIESSKIGSSSQNFTYDKAGNLLTKGNVANGATYIYPSQGAAAIRPHGVTNIPGIGTFEYDDNGNLKSGAGRSIIWNSFDMPVSISGGGQSSSFAYGPEHQRTRQDKTGGISIVYAGNMEIEGPLTAPTSIKTYWPNGLGVEIEKDAETKLYWSHQDRLGSPVALTDETGSLAEKLAYDTWGKRRNLNGDGTPNELDGKIDNKGFTGHEMLDQLDLVHMNGRVYDPLIAKFVSADPNVTDPINGQNYNRYSYVLNNPTNVTDPTGFDPAQSSSFNWLSPSNWSWGASAEKSANTASQQTAANRAENEQKSSANTGDQKAGSELWNDVKKHLQTSWDATISSWNYHKENPSTILEDTLAPLGAASGPRAFIGLGGKAAQFALTGEKIVDACCCFPAGTPVVTEDGTIAIERIRIGQLVLARDEISGVTELKPVTQRFITRGKPLFELVTRSEQGLARLEVTDNHRFWVDGKGWVESASLVPGMVLLDINKQPLSVVSLTALGRTEVTYNFTVADFHTYFAGPQKAFVHNACACIEGANALAKGLAASTVWQGFKKGSLAPHFEKHGAEFGNISQSEYLKQAKAFSAEVGNFLEQKVSNFVVKFDPETRRTFVGHAGSREIRTFYIADGRSANPFQAAIELAEQLAGR